MSTYVGDVPSGAGTYVGDYSQSGGGGISGDGSASAGIQVVGKGSLILPVAPDPLPNSLKGNVNTRRVARVVSGDIGFSMAKTSPTTK